MAFLDVAGTFDIVDLNHRVSSIEAGIVSSDLKNVISALLSTNNTKINAGTYISQIRVMLGVPQGDLLSSLLNYIYTATCVNKTLLREKGAAERVIDSVQRTVMEIVCESLK